VMMVKVSSVPTALNFLAFLHCDLHDVQFLIIFLAAVPKRRRSDSTRLTQGPNLHQPTRGSTTHGQCNISKYAHV
jgi:hypothetical protein